ncbi:MAG TPA: hypothetical protein VD971_09260 [Phycisphaerales bacterium]|nr:hypothetical protein [Phycisphaerales bacterium]
MARFTSASAATLPISGSAVDIPAATADLSVMELKPSSETDVIAKLARGLASDQGLRRAAISLLSHFDAQGVTGPQRNECERFVAETLGTAYLLANGRVSRKSALR